MKKSVGLLIILFCLSSTLIAVEAQNISVAASATSETKLNPSAGGDWIYYFKSALSNSLASNVVWGVKDAKGNWVVKKDRLLMSPFALDLLFKAQELVLVVINSNDSAVNASFAYAPYDKKIDTELLETYNISEAKRLMKTAKENLDNSLSAEKMIQDASDLLYAESIRKKPHPLLGELKKQQSDLKKRSDQLHDTIEQAGTVNGIKFYFKRFNDLIDSFKFNLSELSGSRKTVNLQKMTYAEVTNAITNAVFFSDELNRLIAESRDISGDIGKYLQTNQNDPNFNLTEDKKFPINALDGFAVAREASLTDLKKHIEQVADAGQDRLVVLQVKISTLDQRKAVLFSETLKGEMKTIFTQFGFPDAMTPGKKPGTVVWTYKKKPNGPEQNRDIMFDESTGDLIKRAPAKK